MMNPTALALLAYVYGAMAMWNVMRTAYAFPNITRWFYLLDAAVAVAVLALAIWMSMSVKTQ